MTEQFSPEGIDAITARLFDLAHWCRHALENSPDNARVAVDLADLRTLESALALLRLPRVEGGRSVCTVVELSEHPGKPVSARCILNGCQDFQEEDSTRGGRLRALVATLSKLAAKVTKAHEFQCLRRDRDNEIEYQIFADTDRPKNGVQVAYVQSTRHDAEFIAFALTHAPELAELDALIAAPVVSPQEEGKSNG